MTSLFFSKIAIKPFIASKIDVYTIYDRCSFKNYLSHFYYRENLIIFPHNQFTIVHIFNVLCLFVRTRVYWFFGLLLYFSFFEMPLLDSKYFSIRSWLYFFEISFKRWFFILYEFLTYSLYFCSVANSIYETRIQFLT